MPRVCFLRLLRFPFNNVQKNEGCVIRGQLHSSTETYIVQCWLRIDTAFNPVQWWLRALKSVQLTTVYSPGFVFIYPAIGSEIQVIGSSHYNFVSISDLWAKRLQPNSLSAFFSTFIRTRLQASCTFSTVQLARLKPTHRYIWSANIHPWRIRYHGHYHKSVSTSLPNCVLSRQPEQHH